MATQATYTLVSPPTPGLDPPPGVIPTFHQPYTLQPYVELTISLAIIITTMLMVARIYVKVRIVKKLLIEDYLCIIGWVSFHRHAIFPLTLPFARAIDGLLRLQKSFNGIHGRKPSSSARLLLMLTGLPLSLSILHFKAFRSCPYKFP